MRTKPVVVFRGVGGFNLPIELLVAYYRASTLKDPFFYRLSHHFPENNPALLEACSKPVTFASSPRRSHLMEFTKLDLQGIQKVYHDKLSTNSRDLDPSDAYGNHSLDELYISTVDLGDHHITQDWGAELDDDPHRRELLKEFPEYPSGANKLDIYWMEMRFEKSRPRTRRDLYAFRGDEILCDLVREAIKCELFCERYSLEVIDIPYDVEYEIDESDSGYELIREVHRTW